MPFFVYLIFKTKVVDYALKYETVLTFTEKFLIKFVVY
jgi:hypothetical protein